MTTKIDGNLSSHFIAVTSKPERELTFNQSYLLHNWRLLKKKGKYYGS